MRVRGLLVAVVPMLLSLILFAVTPQFWENFSQDDLLKGTLTRVSLGTDGRLSLAPAFDLVYDTTQPYVFSMVRDKAGNTYVGTGPEGKVVKIDAQGKASAYYQAKELDIFALALDSQDVLYVGSSPDGKVYKVTAANQATEYCNPDEKYIWSMLFDETGNLYIGTGAKGVVYRVDRSGKKSTFFDGDDTHIVSLARSSSGSIIAGTSPGGLVIEINTQGKAFTLLDSSMEEIRSLSVDRFGTIIASATSAKAVSGSTKAEGGESVTPALPIVSVQVLTAQVDRSRDTRSSVTAPGSDKDSTGARSAVYAIAKDGGTETLYSSRDLIVYDAVPRADGSVLIATGGKSRLLLVDPAKQVTVVTDAPDEQLTRLLPAGEAVLVAASNQGRVYRLGTQSAQNGTYESRVLDAKTVATWGKVSWRVAGNAANVELSTRSGNTDKPDNTWSDWSPSYITAAGQAVTSPRGRYLQWRASFKRGTGTADQLERVQLAYLQQNVRPQVVSISLLPYGVALQKPIPLAPGTVPFGTSDGPAMNSPRDRGRDRQPQSPRQLIQPGAQSFTWKATDDNDDALEYSLFFKGEGDAEWKLLEKNLTDSFFTLDAATLPDGIYTLKVVASDGPSNPVGRSLIGELISRPFVVSNATPMLEVAGSKVSGRKADVQFRARVGTGRIASAEFSVDGGEWFLIFPTDGIADSAQEEYQFQTPEMAVGEHVVGLRASDGNGVTGTARVVVRIP
jgi:hypothetical protein